MKYLEKYENNNCYYQNILIQLTRGQVVKHVKELTIQKVHIYF